VRQTARPLPLRLSVLALSGLSTTGRRARAISPHVSLPLLVLSALPACSCGSLFHLVARSWNPFLLLWVSTSESFLDLSTCSVVVVVVVRLHLVIRKRPASQPELRICLLWNFDGVFLYSPE